MSDLQALTGAGNSTVVADLTLHPPRLVDWAQAEIEAAQQYLRTIARGSAELCDSARAAMYARAVDNLRTAPFSFGSAAFDAWALSASALPFMLYLSLRPAADGITRNQSAELLSGSQGDAIARRVGPVGIPRPKKSPGLADFQRRGTGSADRSIGWRGIFLRLTQAGFAYQQISTMTIPQVLHALAMDPGSPRNISSAQTAEIAQRQRRRLLDQIVANNGWLPSDLLLLPPADLERQIKQIGGGTVDTRSLSHHVAQYIAAKTEA